jgi:DNA-nicking Smr family endonuclease
MGSWGRDKRERRMADKETQFADEMGDVTPLNSRGRVVLAQARPAAAGLEQRRRAAVAENAMSNNFLSTEYAPQLGPHDIISFVRPGVQHGVFGKLRRGRYQPEATLDLHRCTVEQARSDLWEFLQDCMECQLRAVMVLHGKGDRSPRAGVLKSYVAHWLRDIPEVLAYHSAQPYHGGAGALYVMLKKTDKASAANRERFLHKQGV